MGQQEAGSKMGSSKKVAFHRCAHYCAGWTSRNLQCVIPAETCHWSPGSVSSLSDRKVLERPGSPEHTVCSLSCLGRKGHDLSCHQLLQPNSPWLQRRFYVNVRIHGKVRARLLHITKIWIHRFILEQGLCNKTKWNHIKAGNWMGCNMTGGSTPTASQEHDTQINAIKLTRFFYF